jgi:hypothetical protein
MTDSFAAVQCIGAEAVRDQRQLAAAHAGWQLVLQVLDLLMASR